MKKMIIFDPAMCCSTGVCGPSVDPELLRVSTIINNLKNNGVMVERYNLSSEPQAFIDNKMINELLNSEGVDILPVTIVDDKVVKTKGYLKTDEFYKLLDVSNDVNKASKSNGCNCKDGCC